MGPVVQEFCEGVEVVEGEKERLERCAKVIFSTGKTQRKGRKEGKGRFTPQGVVR
jgi:hypothetical protein